jgi:hypothetical protein
MGSAIVVWLRKKDDGTRRKYLLTCGHVLRAPAADGTIGYGAQLQDILVWPPMKGFTKSSDYPHRSSDQAVPGSRIAGVSEITPNLPDEIPSGQRQAATDWILLDVDDPEFQQEASVKGFSGEHRQLAVVGYPGGSVAWKTGDNITPTISRPFEVHADLQKGIWAYTGPAETRVGMSGGGVFNEDGLLFGLHRARFDLQIIGQAIAATHIHAELYARGYEVIPFVEEVVPFVEKVIPLVDTVQPVPPSPWHLRLQTINIVLIAAFVLIAMLWSYRVLGVFAVSLIFGGLASMGVGKISSGFVLSQKIREETQAFFFGFLRSPYGTGAIAVLYLVSGGLSFAGTIICVRSLPVGGNEIQIKWGADNQTWQETLSVNQPIWFWTGMMSSTAVRFVAPGFETVTKTVSPWMRTDFHGDDELKHRPFVLVRIGSSLPARVPARDDDVGFRWRLRVTSRSVTNPAEPADTWEPESSYYVGDPIWLGGNGRDWPTNGEVPEGISDDQIHKPLKEHCPLSSDKDYVIELLNQHGEMEFQMKLSHKEIAAIRHPELRQFVKP